MKIIIAGNDRTAALGPALRAEAQRRKAGPYQILMPPNQSALSLREAQNEGEFADRFVQLIRHKHHVGTDSFEIPRRPGLAGRCAAQFKRVLWKLLKYQHERMSFRQNLINTQLASALEFQQDEIRKLAARVAELERR